MEKVLPPPDVFPALWVKLEDLVRSGSLRATEEVQTELERKDDEVLAWASARSGFFVPIDEPIQIAVGDILSRFPKLLDTRSNRSGADPFVIALAQTNGCSVVTGERATTSTGRPNIPAVCRAIGIRSLTVLDLIREQGWRF